MQSLNLQNTPQGTFVTYKLNPDEKLDRMTMGMLTNNQIKGVIPVVYSQIDDERWMKYEVTSMIPLSSYLANVLTRQKVLELLKQVTEVFILAEDYMIDAAFIVLNPRDVFVNPVTGEIGILCLPVVGYVCEVTVRSFFASVMTMTRFSPAESRDYVVQIQNFVNGGQFSISGFQKMLEELIHGGVKRVQRERTSGTVTSMEEADSQMAVAVEAVAQMTNQNRESRTIEKPEQQMGFNRIPVTESGNTQAVSQMVPQEKPEKEKKGLFGRKKKEKKQKKAEVAPGITIPGMSIPGMPETEEQLSASSRPAPSKPLVSEAPVSKSKVSMQPEIPVRKQEVSAPVQNMNLSSIADSISGRKNGTMLTLADDKPEWSISPDYNEVAISDATVFLDVSQAGGTEAPALQEPPAVLQRVRTGEMITLGKDEFTLGKDGSQVDYCISNNGTISRVHAKIVRRNNQYFIVDQNSLNHTYVNERPVLPAREEPLLNHSSIRLSDEEFLFTAP